MKWSSAQLKTNLRCSDSNLLALESEEKIGLSPCVFWRCFPKTELRPHEKTKNFGGGDTCSEYFGNLFGTQRFERSLDLRSFLFLVRVDGLPGVLSFESDTGRIHVEVEHDINSSVNSI